ncbi:MFS transporter [Dactylosporangium aurantiacum]|uniref:MFS transporter n=1 Tax=Dactylosporangium aurantiacum TaxID=35754 RepID=A0A9Q9IDU0_9ACTN|nr:MFS transporter [Dactylosporangium aurantiacum]MDG6106905.1 MFS transporter [Dactylosporangium aurantiacum]UWZ50730.1 MFS transporter [Dactylosporangium aurantiacum]
MATVTPPTQTPAAPVQDRSVRPNAVLAAALLGFVVISLDALVVNVALPDIGQDLHGGIAGLQWIVDGYTLTFAAFMLSAGAFSDRVGASRAFAGGLVVFTVASVACGLATEMWMLVAARLVQGLAASVTMPASLALVRQAFPDMHERTRAIATWTAGGAIATTVGPAFGGLLTSAWNWRTIFFINLPIGIIGLILLRRAPHSPRRAAPLDLLGQVLAVLGLAGLTVGVIEGGDRGYGAPEVIGAFVLAAVAVIAFLFVEHRQEHPTMPLGLFRLRPVSISIAAGFAVNVAWYGTIFLLSLFFQQELHRNALVSGLMFVPTTALVALSNLFVAAKVIQRFGPRLPMVIGQAGTVVGLILLLFVDADTPPALVALVAVPVGFAGALAVPALTGLLLGSVEAERAGTAAGVLNTIRQTGGAIAVAVFGALVASQAGFAAGMRISLAIAAIALGLTAVLTFAALPGRKAPAADR